MATQLFDIYTSVYSHPIISFVLFALYLALFGGLVFVKWKQCSLVIKAILLSAILIPLVLVGLFWFESNPKSSSDSIDTSDYMGGCAVERYINGDCMFDSVKNTHANFYPLVTEDDGVWKKLEGYDKETLMKTAEQELERLKKIQYKGQREQISRVQSFIDILSKR